MMRRILMMTACLGAALPGFAQEAPPFATFDAASEAVLNDPHDLAIGPDGRLYIADKFGNRITVMDAETLEVIEHLAEGQLLGVHDISFGADGAVAVAVTGLGAVGIWPTADEIGTESGDVVPAPRTEGALLHSSGRIYAMASGTGTVLAYDDGRLVAAAEGHFGAHDIAEDLEGNIWVADNASARLVKYSPDLELLDVLNGPQFGFVGPRYLDVNDFGHLVVADQDAHRVLLIDPVAEALIGVLGDGSPGLGPMKFDDPEGVAEHGGRYYISDSDNNRIVRYVVVMN